MKRIAALVTMIVLALGGTAHAASYDAAQAQALLDKAVKAAGPGFTVNAAASQGPAAFTATTPAGVTAAEQYKVVGTGTRLLNGGPDGKGYLTGLSVSLGQTETAASAVAFWKATETRVNGFSYGPTVGPPTGFATTKIRGRPVTTYQQATSPRGDSTLDSTKVLAAFVDGRSVLTLTVDNSDPAQAMTLLKNWISRYLKKS